MLLIVPQTRELLCLMEKCVSGRKGSWIGSFLLRSSPQVRTTSKRTYLGKFLTCNLDLPIWKAGGR